MHQTVFFRSFLCSVLCFLFSCGAFAQQGWEQQLLQSADYYYAANSFGAASQYFQQQRDLSLAANAQVEARFYTLSSALRLNTAGAEKMLTAFMIDHPTSYLTETAYLDAANFYFNQGKYSYALKWYAKLSEKEVAKAQLPKYYFNKGYTNFATKRFKKAKPLFEKVKENPEYAGDANYYLGYIAYQLEDFEEANRNFDKLNRSEDDNTIGYFQADMNFKLGRFDEAILLARKSLKGADKKETSELSKIIGESYFNLQDYRSALPYLLAYEGKRGRWSNTDFYQLGYAHYRMKAYTEAIEQFNKIISTNNAVAQNAYYHLADSYLKTDQKTAALNAFKRASEMKFSPTIQEDALLNYAKLSYAIGNSYENPAVVVQRFISAYPKNKNVGRLEVLLLDSYVSSQNFDAALELLDKLPGAKYDEARQKVMYMKATALFKAGQYAAAEKYYQSVIKLDNDPALSAASGYWQAQSLFERKRYQAAIDAYRAAQTHPRMKDLEEAAQLDYNLGYAHFKAKQYPEAITAFEAFLATNPSLSYERDTRLRLGDCHFVLKTYWPAMDQYEKVIELFPYQAPYATYQQAISYGFVDRNAQKIALLKNLIDRYPKSPLLDDGLFALAQAHAKDNAIDLAITTYDRLLLGHPKSPYRSRAYLNKGLLQYNSAQNEAAQNTLKALVEAYPNAAITQQALQTVKEIAIEENTVDAFSQWLATQNLKELPDLKLEKASFDAIERLLNDGKKNALKKALTNYIATYPNGANLLRAHFLLGELLYEKNDPEAAMVHFGTIVDNPANAYTEQALVRLTQILLQLDQAEKALPVFQRLEQEAQFAENKRYALANQMQYYFNKKDHGNALAYANKVLAQKEVKESVQWDAQYIRAKSAQAVNDLKQAQQAFKVLENAPQGERAVEALYFDAQQKHNNKAFADSNVVIEKIAQDYSGYPEWAAKSLLLMSKNFYQLDDAFQASFILESLLENFTQFPVLIEAAKTDLANIKKVEAENNSSININEVENQ